MKSINNPKDEELKQVKSKVNLDNITSDYFIERIFNFMKKKLSLEIMKYSKKLQNRLKINLNDYKLYSQIEIELILGEDKYNNFINIPPKENNDYFHFYFNNTNQEIKRTELNEYDNVKSIKIIIDHQVKSLQNLFLDCQCISSINFKNFIEQILLTRNSCSVGALH